MTPAIHTAFYLSPIGTICITGTEEGIISINFCDASDTIPSRLPQPLSECIKQLDAYFNKELQEFDLPLLPRGTAFQLKVWNTLKAIPYGSTASYLDIARFVSDMKAIRAVGAANGKNPHCIVVPCHRVIGSNGNLIGYSGGLWRKEWLLQHEGVLQPEKQLDLF